jgi:anti-sigma factor RsiW
MICPTTLHDSVLDADDWLAQQYVLGELPAVAASAFESRLADDAALCQRVADAACLVATVQAARPQSVAVPSAPVAPQRRGAAIAAVAAAAVCLFVSILPRPDQPASPQDQGVAAKWLSLWRGQGDVLRSTLARDSESDGLEDSAEWSSDQVPSWMIAAVSLERRDASRGHVAPGHPAPVPAPGHDDDLEEN